MKKLIYTAICLLLIFAACEPIENRDQLGPAISADQIDVEVIGVTPGSNKVIVINHTPQYGGAWTLPEKTTQNEVDTALLSFLGETVFTFNAITDGGIITIEKTYDATVYEYPITPYLPLLCGTAKGGKTWVWAFDSPSLKGFGPWGTGAFLQDQVPTKTGLTEPSSFEGTQIDEMTFDVNGDYNYSIISNNTTANGNPAGTFKANFKLDIRPAKSKFDADSVAWTIGDIKISGGDKPTISRGFSQNEKNKKVVTFDVVKLTENELILAYVPKTSLAKGDEAWFWVFKPKGYNY